MKETTDIKFTLRFDLQEKREASTYKAMTEAAYESGRSYNKEILHVLRSYYGVKK
jgi:hypothetical protein